ncbi:sensor histidine kinase [Candidatus Poriferisodalis sp.]|uniref:sensor histidine kinase n=1 Tax=Candidatus Poriferisodalis sp. TaxID=3101277 RepID=UPI003D13F30D
MIAALAGLALAVAGIAVVVVMHLRARNSTAERLGRIAHRLDHASHDVDQGDRSLQDWIGYLESVATTAAMNANLADRDRARWQLAVNELTVGVVLVDEDGAVCASNALADEMLGARDAMALVGAAVTQLLDAASAGHSRTRTVKLTGPPPRVIEVSAHPVSGTQHALGAVAVIADRTEGARVDDVRRDFVANLSHELRTPVGAISLLAETLAEEDDQSVRTRLVDRIGTEADRVRHITDDLLELSRVEMEGLIRQEPVPVVPLLCEVAQQYSEHARERGVELVRPTGVAGAGADADADAGADAADADADAGDQITLHADRGQLFRAVGNLVDNAIKYSDPGSKVRLSVARGNDVEPPTWLTSEDVPATRIPVADSSRSPSESGTPIEEWVDIVVADEGIGIPGDETERVFERFYRVDKARARATGGTGLGLSIVRHVVANHGGAVVLQSSEGLGTTFTLRFPALQDPAPVASVPDDSVPQAPTPDIESSSTAQVRR